MTRNTFWSYSPGTKLKAEYILFLQKIFNPNTISNALHVEMRNMLKVGARVVGACFVLRTALVELCSNSLFHDQQHSCIARTLVGNGLRGAWIACTLFLKLPVYIYMCMHLPWHTCAHIHIHIYMTTLDGGRVLNVWSFSLIRGVPTALGEEKRFNNCSHQLKFLLQSMCSLCIYMVCVWTLWLVKTTQEPSRALFGDRLLLWNEE